ncbi:hypothetical protein AABB24_010942 [Solanum stoloniferum]|uniref:Uncharacterized protein n=1 Tax=Solanum stoloniferum TaxID=62892 RepID=A0ABD2UEJ8_9SOLN
MYLLLPNTCILPQTYIFTLFDLYTSVYRCISMYTSCISACFQLFETCFQFPALVFTTFHLFVNFSIPRGADSENKWIWAFVAHFEMQGGEESIMDSKHIHMQQKERHKSKDHKNSIEKYKESGNRPLLTSTSLPHNSIISNNIE